MAPENREKEMIPVLDRGYVRLVDHMGNDLRVVNSARVSFMKESFEMSEKDANLIKFLAHEVPPHTSPFRHSILQFEVYAPLMVARQWWKYIIGSDHADQPTRNHDPFLAWNESSRRYVTEQVEFYTVEPEQWRSKPEKKKQGSGDPVPLDIGQEATRRLIETYEKALDNYEWALENGICAEQARLFLPAYGLYVRWYWTASLQGVCHLLNQRLAKDAQKEFQEYAKAVYRLTHKYFPVAVKEAVMWGMEE